MDITLALGGGGSRGYSHIGVIRRLEQEGIRIRAVAGTSAGGIIATLFAAGFSPDDMEDRLSKLDQNTLFSRSGREEPSILGFQGARKVLEETIGDLTFDKLKIPCAVVAVDINTAQEVILKKGRIVDAILASGAIPAIFPPQKIGEHVLVDGATLNPVPVSVARSLAPTLPVVAVVLTPPSGRGSHTRSLHIPTRIPGVIMDRISHLRLAQALNIFIQATDVGSHMLAELRLKIDDPDVIVRPAVENIGMLEKVDVRDVSHLGELAMGAKIQELKRTSTWSNRMKRYFTQMREN